MSDVFISYRREDKPRMEALARAFESLGLTVFFDARIPTGSVFDEVVDKELKVAKAVIVCWTQGAVESRWVRSESLIGLEREILVAAFFEQVSLPPPYNIVQAEDLRSWSGDLGDPQFQKILARVGELVGRPDLAQEAAARAREEAWRARDRDARKEFAAKLEEARIAFDAETRERPAAFEARLDGVHTSFEAWLEKRRAGASAAMPDPMSAVENNTEKLRAELAAVRRERDTASAMASRLTAEKQKLEQRLAKHKDAPAAPTKAEKAPVRTEPPPPSAAAKPQSIEDYAHIVLRAVLVFIIGPFSALVFRQRGLAILWAILAPAIVVLIIAVMVMGNRTPFEIALRYNFGQGPGPYLGMFLSANFLLAITYLVQTLRGRAMPFAARRPHAEPRAKLSTTLIDAASILLLGPFSFIRLGSANVVLAWLAVAAIILSWATIASDGMSNAFNNWMNASTPNQLAILLALNLLTTILFLIAVLFGRKRWFRSARPAPATAS